VKTDHRNITIKRRNKSFCKPVCIVSTLLVGSLGVPVLAEADSQIFNIPAQPMDSALTELADRAGLRLLYQADAVGRLMSRPVTGARSPEQALSIMLGGSGLRYRKTADKAITIEKARAAEKETEGNLMNPVTVTGRAEYDSADPYNPDYNRATASTATKTDTPIMETPMSVQVVTQQVMRDQQVVTVEEAVKNVSGVQRDWGYGSLYDSFIIRGFASSSDYRNGFRLQNYAPETANVERIDVLKGPAAMLYGRVEPGGIVNIVTKKPLDTAYYSLQQQFGSYDFYRTTLDATGPVADDKALLYRFNLAYTGADSFRDFVFTDRLFLAPSLTWKPTEADEVNLNFEYNDNAFAIDNGIPALNGANRPVDIPISRTFHEPGSNAKVEDYLVDLNWTHRFNADWQLRDGFVAKIQDYTLETVVAPFVQDDNRHVGRFANFSNYPDRHSYGAFIDLTGHFDTYGINHDVLVGGDWFEYAQTLVGSFQPVSDMDIFNPVYGSVDFDRQRANRDLNPNMFFTGYDEWFGIYFQDQITLWDKLHLLGGGRHDWTRAKSGFSDVSMAAATGAQSIVDTDRFQPRFGILYQPWQWLSLYGNYIESLGSNNGRSSTNQPFQPEIADQFEAGIKTDFFDGRLSSTLAYFYIEKQNILTADLSTPDDIFDQVAIGKARSQGIELDMKGQITEALSVIATYAFTDARITANADGNVGNRLPNVPENSGSLWAKYDFIGTPLNGFSLGSGVYVAGQREGDNENTLQLPGYARWDAMAAYRFKLGETRLTAQLNVNNILDKAYFKATDTIDGNPRGRVTVGEPRTFMGSIRLEY
jgi:iron complex outermembrane receptor protein